MSNKPKCSSCGNQIRRFAAKPFYETIRPEGLIELADTLHRYGHGRAEMIVDEAMIRSWGDNDTDRVPSPSQIWALCKENPQDFKSLAQEKPPVKAPQDCPECFGTGWKVIEADSRLSGKLTGVARCSNLCPVPGEKAVFDPPKYSRDDAGYDKWRTQLVTEIQAVIDARKVAAKRGFPPPMPPDRVTEADFAAVLEKKA
jgi:hypothetical protein